MVLLTGQYELQMDQMITICVTVRKQLVKVDRQELVDYVLEDGNHKRLEDSQGVIQSHQHHQNLVVSVLSTESCLLDIFASNPDPVKFRL